MTFTIIWPDHRTVSAEQIDMWFSDAIDNGEIDDDPALYSTEEKARELHNLGVITLRRSDP